MIHILISQIKEPLSPDSWGRYLNQVSEEMQKKTLRFRRWQDQYAYLFSKLLLLEGLKQQGLSSQSLDSLKFTPYNRPYLEGDIDFNIAHSGEWVLCAISKGTQVGIDIEKIRPVPFQDFENVMTAEQWESIHNHPDPPALFFKYWTMKESLIKADGKGLSLPLLDIHLHQKDRVDLYDQTWHLKEVKGDPQYVAFLASSQPISTYQCKRKDFN